MIRGDVEEILPAGPGGFDPSQAIADPAPLFAHAERTVGPEMPEPEPVPEEQLSIEDAA